MNMIDSATLYSPAHVIQALARGYRLPSDLATLEGACWGNYGHSEVLMVCNAISAVMVERDHLEALHICKGDSALAVAVREWIWANMHLMDKTPADFTLEGVGIEPMKDVHAQYFHLKAVRTLIEAFGLRRDPHWGQVSFQGMIMQARIEQDWKLEGSERQEETPA